MYSDEYIEACYQRFAIKRVATWGISFIQYLTNPALYRWAESQPPPLLPKQEAVKRRLIKEEFNKGMLPIFAYPKKEKGHDH